MGFSERLKELRFEKGLTLDDLEKNLQITKSTLSRYENNKRLPDIEIAQRIADFFGVTTDYLLGKSLLRNSSEQIAFHLNADGLDPEDLVVIQNLIDQLRKKQKK